VVRPFYTRLQRIGYAHFTVVSANLIHGVAPDYMYSSTIIPIPKGKHANVTDSSNYRGIALSSIFGKVFDLFFLDKYSDCLCTSELQFGFKAGHFTDMCSMVLKETLAYYVVDGGSAFCTFLDAIKAFDRIDYCKLELCADELMVGGGVGWS